MSVLDKMVTLGKYLGSKKTRQERNRAALLTTNDPKQLSHLAKKAGIIEAANALLKNAETMVGCCDKGTIFLRTAVAENITVREKDLFFSLNTLNVLVDGESVFTYQKSDEDGGSTTETVAIIPGPWMNKLVSAAATCG